MQVTRYFTIISMMLVTLLASAQENLQRGAIASSEKKFFKAVKENPITSVKNQNRSGTCWDYASTWLTDRRLAGQL